MRQEGRSYQTSGGWESIAFILLCAALLVFGLLMIYSASSIVALTAGESPAAYVVTQLKNTALGLVLALIVAFNDYHTWSERLLAPIWVVTVIMLGLVLTNLAGADAYGATRWFSLGPIHLQPSEFAKATLLMCAAFFIQQLFEGQEDLQPVLVRAGIVMGIPLLLILLEPDKGTVLIVCVTTAIMLFVAGMPMKVVLAVAAGALLIIAVLAMKDEYSRRRIMIMANPWLDEYGDGYQLIQGRYAFGSGGLFGVGIGNSRQKYSYLPMAHNDFIFAVIGEELGLVGTMLVLVAFLALLYLGFRIARSAPDLAGCLIASGGVSMLVVQLLVNVCGVLGIIPLSGKPIPFLSYGGSSIMTTLVLAALVVSVARTSKVSAPATAGARPSFRVYEGGQSGFRVIEGGGSTTPESLRASRDFAATHTRGRVSVGSNGMRRIDLGPSAGERLRR